MLNRFAWCQRFDRSGQSIVEIGLVTPFLLIALYVPIDFGIAYYTAQLTQNAVREAARIAVSTKDPFDNAAANDIAIQARDRLLPLRLKEVTVTVEYFGPASATCMQSVSVTAAGSYDYFFYQMLGLVGATVNPIQIRRVSRMRYEFQPVTNSTPACGPTPSLTGTANGT